ncbi:hypothetical protein [Paenibacillus uliginis]|uniref:hypothetical protein n=1 Tax=Paenibacillus uliginis TaxID=683737 RepID=UPI001AEC8D97|nr:hypothetical protein [Paenibacillus uliginis]
MLLQGPAALLEGPLLVKAGHVVVGLTRNPGNLEFLHSEGVQPVLVDVFVCCSARNQGLGRISGRMRDVIDLIQLAQNGDRPYDRPRLHILPVSITRLPIYS